MNPIKSYTLKGTGHLPIHLAMPTSTTPCLSLDNCFSGRVAQASPSMTNGAITQLRRIERASCCQILGVENTLGRRSYCTLVRIGHIMRMRPIRMAMGVSVSGRSEGRNGWKRNARIDTPSQEAPLNARWTSLSYKRKRSVYFLVENSLCRAPCH